MKHILTIQGACIEQPDHTSACGECQSSCQSACKTSCTVGNQACENDQR